MRITKSSKKIKNIHENYVQAQKKSEKYSVRVYRVGWIDIYKANLCICSRRIWLKS